jgi:uncharacterized protein
MEELVMSGQICHIEIPADNLESLRKFYSGLFDWDFEKMPGDIEYYGAKQGEDKPGIGMMARQDPKHTPTFYVCVDSVDSAIERAKNDEATIIVPKTAVKGMGWYAVALDPQKNLFGLWQADDKAE